MNRKIRWCARWLPGLFLILLFTSCRSSHQINLEPVEVKPIHITIDVNIRVERALEDFFSDLDEESSTIQESTPTTGVK